MKSTLFLAFLLLTSLLTGSACALFSDDDEPEQAPESTHAKLLRTLTGNYTGELSVQFTLLNDSSDEADEPNTARVTAIGTFTNKLSAYTIQHKFKDNSQPDKEVGELLGHYAKNKPVLLHFKATMKDFATTDGKTHYKLSDMELFFNRGEVPSPKNERVQGVSDANFNYTCQIENVAGDTWAEIFTDLGITVSDEVQIPSEAQMRMALTIRQTAKK